MCSLLITISPVDTMEDDELETESVKDLFIGSWKEDQYKRVGLNNFLSKRGNI